MLRSNVVLEIKNPPKMRWESAVAAEQESATRPAQSRTTTHRGEVHSHPFQDTWLLAGLARGRVVKKLFELCTRFAQFTLIVEIFM